MAEPARLSAAHRLSEKLTASPLWSSAHCVGVTMSMDSEISTSGIIDAARQSGKTILLPRVIAPHTMEFFEYTPSTHLVRSRFGVLEPVGEQPFQGVPDVLVVPGLAFSSSGDRLGYGGGFYDAWLSRHRGTHMTTVGLALSWQVVERSSWPVDVWDRRIDRIITDSSVTK